MSSEHDELMDEGLVKSDAEKSDSPSPKKSGGGVVKPKRRGRRGKKRKQRKESGDSSHYSEEQEGSRAAEPWDSNEEEKASENYSGQMLRPNAPHAPKNSTQFIIDDHNECRLYMSFETPNPYLATAATTNGGDMMMGPPIGEDAAYVDVDFQYESPQDFDNTAYYDREFELSYKSNRFEELLRLPRDRLVSGLRQLEQRLKELSDDLVKENPSPILEKLQHDLLELQEKHCELREANTRLTALVAQKESNGKRDERNIDLSIVTDIGEKTQLSDDTSVKTEYQEVERSDAHLSGPTMNKQLGAESEAVIFGKRLIKDDLGNDHCESGDKQFSEPMEEEKRKNCLEGQLSEPSSCDASTGNVLEEHFE